MQPSSLSVSHSSTPEQVPSHSSTTRQYGEQTAATIPSPDIRPGDGTHPTSALGTIDSELRSTLTPSPSGRNRVAEYESTPISAKPKKRNGGPAFDVIKKRGSSSDDSSQLLNLPNEVLTHTLANLSPTDLTSVSLVSRRLHELVTTQHAWRVAFSRFFPGSESLRSSFADDDDSEDEQNTFVAAKRDFTRLTALASWRSEYILRTRLLRSLARGKPVQASMQHAAPRSAQSHTASPIRLYNSQLYTTINHLHVNFGTGLNKSVPTAIHGADDMGMVSTSDLSAANIVQNWGMATPTMAQQFSDRYVGERLYGLGAAQIVGVPNQMDVSALHGMICAEGWPGGSTHFRVLDMAKNGRSWRLAPSQGTSAFDLGMPKISHSKETPCSLWIAKTASIPTLTDGMIGMMTGSSLGVLSAYSLGLVSGRDQGYVLGEMTARWILCPGVPIISICVDQNHTYGRLGQQRIWAVVLNALGEVFYLTSFPKPAAESQPTQRDPSKNELAAWENGRSVFWALAEPTRRTARPDPYGQSSVDGSYTPRSSWKRMYLSKDQLHAEARELETFLAKKPLDIQAMCFGWDMRRKLEVDFANDDGNNAGETIVVISTGLDEASTTSIMRYTRTRTPPQEDTDVSPVALPQAVATVKEERKSSLFGGPPTAGLDADAPADNSNAENVAPDDKLAPPSAKLRPSSDEEWRTSTLTFAGLKGVQVTASCLDNSIFAVSTAREDPSLSFSGASSAPSPTLTPLSADEGVSTPQDVPGQRARLLTIGTSLGTILVFNVRAAFSQMPSVTTSIDPTRIIHTDSPAISCLGLSSLYLVSGGTDGLVQAWDPLASSTSPVRTLHSRFSSRARRRLAQAAASPQGVGINLFAAGALFLDPDPTVLRGLVSLGTHLLYWHFSGSAADAYKSHKRRLRRSERMSNGAGERYTPTPRAGGVKRFIENERWDAQADDYREKQESARMAGRYGTELLGESATEEDLIAYAAMLSQEAFEADEERRQSLTPNTKDVSSRASPAPESRQTPLRQSSVAVPDGDNDLDADLEEAIRQSLALGGHETQESYVHAEQTLDIPIKYAKSKKRSPRNSPRTTAVHPEVGGSKDREKEELEFALQISLAEERSKLDVDDEWERIEKDHAWPLSGPAKRKGKDRAEE